MRFFSFFRRKSAPTIPSSASTSARAKPRGKIAAPALVGVRRVEPKEVADLAERMDRDYQVQLARRVLAANIQSVRVSIAATGPQGRDPRVAALVEHLQRLWDESVPNMLPAVAYGRVAFEKVFAYDPAHNLIVTQALDPLPYRETELMLGAEGAYEGIDVAIGKSKVRVPADKSWWLALDATVIEPHGRSQYLGAPAETFRRREKTRKRFDTLMNRLSVRGFIAYHPLDEEDERGNRYDPGEVLAGQLDALVSGGHLLLPNTRHPVVNDYAYKVQETTEVLETAPLLAAIADEDAEQLRAFGIPEKTITEGDSVGSHAMVKQQTLALYAIVDGLLAQFTTSFRKYVIDKSVELNFDPAQRPQITINCPRLAERPDSILVQVVTGMLGTPHLNPLVQCGAIDVQQLLESAGIPLSGDVHQQLARLQSEQPGPKVPQSGQRIPGGQASLDEDFEEKHPRRNGGEFAPKGAGEEHSNADASDQSDSSKRIDRKLYSNLDRAREDKIESFRQAVTDATEALTEEPDLTIEERAAIVQDLRQKADEADEMGESQWATLLKRVAGEHVKAHSHAATEEAFAPLLDEPTEPSERVTTNFDNIPLDRVQGLVAEGLAREEDGWVYIADVAPGNRISITVLEPIRMPANLDEIEQSGGRIYQDEERYETVGYRVASCSTIPNHDEGTLEKYRSYDAAHRYIRVAKSAKEAGQNQLRAGQATFILHMLPLGEAADEASQGHIWKASIALAGDAASLLSGPLAKSAKGTKALRVLDGTLAAVHGAQGIFAIKGGNNLEAAGYFGEATLRLLGMSKPAIEALQKAPKPLSPPIVFFKRHGDSKVLRKKARRGPNGGKLESHHSLQEGWAKENIPGYRPKLAPTAAIERGQGLPHTIITDLQRARRDARIQAGLGKWSSTIDDELRSIVSDYRAAGFGDDVIKKVLQQNYKMLNKLGVKYTRPRGFSSEMRHD